MYSYVHAGRLPHNLSSSFVSFSLFEDIANRIQSQHLFTNVSLYERVREQRVTIGVGYSCEIFKTDRLIQVN